MEEINGKKWQENNMLQNIICNIITPDCQASYCESMLINKVFSRVFVHIQSLNTAQKYWPFSTTFFSDRNTSAIAEINFW